jgi:hypothetical protein
MGHEIAGCLLVKLFALHTTSFCVIFKRKGETPEEQRLSNKLHIQDWILVVSLLLQWHQWMKQPTIAKEQVKNIAPPAPIGGAMTVAAGGGATTGTVRKGANLRDAQRAMLRSSTAR